MKIGGQAGGHREIQLAEVLISIFAVQLEGEGAERTSFGITGTGDERGIKGTNLAGTFRIVGT